MGEFCFSSKQIGNSRTAKFSLECLKNTWLFQNTSIITKKVFNFLILVKWGHLFETYIDFTCFVSRFRTINPRSRRSVNTKSKKGKKFQQQHRVRLRDWLSGWFPMLPWKQNCPLFDYFTFSRSKSLQFQLSLVCLATLTRSMSQMTEHPSSLLLIHPKNE